MPLCRLLTPRDPAIRIGADPEGRDDRVHDGGDLGGNRFLAGGCRPPLAQSHAHPPAPRVRSARERGLEASTVVYGS